MKHSLVLLLVLALWPWPLLAQAVCPTTVDGLPLCPHVAMTAQKCLAVFPPDGVGGFCEWYGYATKAQVDRFERHRGFVRVVHENGSSDTWRATTDWARRFVDCRLKEARGYLAYADPSGGRTNWKESLADRVRARCGTP